jgi:soluble lytic murein transglycosylase-like protein
MLAGDQNKAVERQLAAAKRQRESVQARKASGQFFETAWLSQENTEQAAPAPDCDKLPAEELQTLIARIPLEGLSPVLIQSVIDQESAGRPCAVSNKGAMGLMQIMPDLARDMDVDDPFDPEQNLRAGIRHLVHLTARYKGDLPKILAAYNAGIARVDSSGGVPDIPETQAYVKSILARLAR